MTTPHPHVHCTLAHKRSGPETLEEHVKEWNHLFHEKPKRGVHDRYAQYRKDTKEFCWDRFESFDNRTKTVFEAHRQDYHVRTLDLAVLPQERPTDAFEVQSFRSERARN